VCLVTQRITHFFIEKCDKIFIVRQRQKGNTALRAFMPLNVGLNKSGPFSINDTGLGLGLGLALTLSLTLTLTLVVLNRQVFVIYSVCNFKTFTQTFHVREGFQINCGDS
jgi:hypothetical protein